MGKTANKTGSIGQQNKNNVISIFFKKYYFA